MTNQINPKSFILFQEYKQNISLLSQSQKGDLLDAIFAYNEGEKITLEPVVNMAFSFIKSDLDRNREKYQNIVERNKINGSRGGRPKTQENPVGYLETQENPKNLDNDNDNDNKDDNGNKELESQFKSFWDKYDKKVSRGDAEKKFKQALKKESFETIMSGLDSYIKSRGDDSKYWKHPSTWLNQECWNDEYKNESKEDSPFANYAHLRSK